MNLCKKFRKVILTDYIDAEMSQEMKGYVEEHLHECVNCRAFLEEVKQKLVLPFKEIKHESVPETLWPAIKGKICERREYLENAKVSLVGRLRGYFSIPRLSPALVSLALLILIGTLVFYNQQARISREKERADYLSSFLGTTGALLETTTNNFGTFIEEFFL